MVQLGLMLLVKKYKGIDMHCNNGLNNKLVKSLVENKVAEETGDLKYLQDSMYDFVKTLKEIILGEYAPEFFEAYFEEATKEFGGSLEEFLSIPLLAKDIKEAIRDLEITKATIIQQANEDLRRHNIALEERIEILENRLN